MMRPLGALLMALSVATAAPKLRLSQTAITINIVPGSNGATQTIGFSNAGDGSLHLKVESTAPWAEPGIGLDQTSIQIAFQTANLVKGSYTAFVVVGDPDAIDAPQNIVVVAQVGGQVPDQLEYYVPPGGTASMSFQTGSIATATASGAQWLSISGGGMGTFGFRYNTPFSVRVSAPQGMAVGLYRASLAISGSAFPPDNKTVPVTMHVTDLPVMQATPASFLLRVAQGTKRTATVALSNAGSDVFAVRGTSASTLSGGDWLSASNASGLSVTADATGLPPGTYDGTVSVSGVCTPGTPFGPRCLPANDPLLIPVEMIVVPAGPPLAFYSGVVNDATFAAFTDLAPGDMAAVFGEQFTLDDAASATSVPLPTSLGGIQVLVNDIPAPLYYVSYGQINFQIPNEASVADTLLRVDRNGVHGNSVSMRIAPVAPQLFGPVANSNGAWVISANPAKAGDTLTLYAIGLGATSPPIPSGAAGPSAEPLARVTSPIEVWFDPVHVEPEFAGLAPGFVGLYQVNVTVPRGVPAGDRVPTWLRMGAVNSNTIFIALH
jgi:uncharacterized protein (TIGR03437 family)